MIGLLGAAVPGLPAWVWRVVFYGLLALSLLGFGYLKGDEHGTEKLTDYKGQQAIASVVAIKIHDQVAGPVVDHYITKTKVIHDQIQEVQDAIGKSVPRGMVLSYSWRLSIDAAATGTVPDPAGTIDGPGVDAQDAARSIVDNYGTARANAEELTGLQDWVCRNWKIDHAGQTPPFECPP